MDRLKGLFNSSVGLSFVPLGVAAYGSGQAQLDLLHLFPVCHCIEALKPDSTHLCYPRP
jgi:hypothetical protein